jgi:hypothetical protein
VLEDLKFFAVGHPEISQPHSVGCNLASPIATGDKQEHSSVGTVIVVLQSPEYPPSFASNSYVIDAFSPFSTA